MKKVMLRLSIIVILITFFIWFIPIIVINSKRQYIIENYDINHMYNLSNLYNVLKANTTIELDVEENVIYNGICKVSVSTINFSNNKNSIKIFVDNVTLNDEEIEKIKKLGYMEFSNEGKHEIKVQILQDTDIVSEDTKIVYYIKKYKKQFLDELSNKGTIVHYLNGSWEKYEKTADLLINCGIKNIRTTFSWKDIEIDNDIFKFNYYDKWIQKLTDNGVNIIACFNRIEKYSGTDGIINTEEEKNEFLKFAKEVIKRYPQIKNYEFVNEPNLKKYITDDDLKWYSTVLKELSEVKGVNIISGGTNTPNEDSEQGLKSSTFLKKLFDNEVYQYCYNYAYHPYDSYNNIMQNSRLYMKLNEHKMIFEDIGGFIKQYITEYGIHITDLEVQASKIIQQAIILDEYQVKYAIQYNFWNTGDNLNNVQNNYGLINYDYTPKPSYYAMKNYYENTNGAEYIGTVNIAEGLEGHVYDKGGNPIIITWSENSTNNIQIDYKGFTAKDLYGKDIQPDENGKLTITTSPVYLYDVDYNYFYKAISNVATSKYDEFKEKFVKEISQISGFEEKINQRQNYSQSVANTQKLMQNTAITAMKSHYELGDIILKAYEEGQLKAEPVKISSMLDMINDIGNSYEDLVTVSVNNTINSVMKTLDEANVDSSELTITKQKIEETENLINTNTDVEIIYPTKILQFSKDCYEKADYINSLEEQNDIKAGLIISNNLHAQLLADWANKFASIQINNNINEYIAQNPVTIEYSETNITNKSVKATIKTNAEIQITNNSNSKEYVFDQNGSFTFEYTIKGQAKQITAKVTNIDKTLPIINGVIDGKLYTSKITPTITDENIDTIKLILNGEEVKNFKSVTTLIEEGFYTLTAIDKAGNKTQISFQIMENNNQNYIIQDNIIKNISEQTIKSDFDNKLKLGITYKITRNEKEITSTDNIATGDILTTSAGDKYTLIVTGDLNKDGKLNLKDLVKMRKYFLDGNNLGENEILAANCNFDGKINLKDLVKMRLMLLNQDATK